MAVRVKAAQPTTQSAVYDERFEKAVTLLDAVFTDISMSNPNRCEISYHVKARWQDEVQEARDLLLDLRRELLEEGTPEGDQVA